MSGDWGFLLRNAAYTVPRTQDITLTASLSTSERTVSTTCQRCGSCTQITTAPSAQRLCFRAISADHIYTLLQAVQSTQLWHSLVAASDSAFVWQYSALRCDYRAPCCVHRRLAIPQVRTSVAAPLPDRIAETTHLIYGSAAPVAKCSYLSGGIRIPSGLMSVCHGFPSSTNQQRGSASAQSTSISICAVWKERQRGFNWLAACALPTRS
jgi:hypothetical protein